MADLMHLGEILPLRKRVLKFIKKPQKFNHDEWDGRWWHFINRDGLDFVVNMKMIEPAAENQPFNFGDCLSFNGIIWRPFDYQPLGTRTPIRLIMSMPAAGNGAFSYDAIWTYSGTEIKVLGTLENYNVAKKEQANKEKIYQNILETLGVSEAEAWRKTNKEESKIIKQWVRSR